MAVWTCTVVGLTPTAVIMTLSVNSHQMHVDDSSINCDLYEKSFIDTYKNNVFAFLLKGIVQCFKCIMSKWRAVTTGTKLFYTV